MYNTRIIFLVLIIFTSISVADELYVLKNVKVHTEASLESPVTKLLLGGEKINVLSIDGDFTEIEDIDEKIGWVASEFLTDIEPPEPVKKEPQQTGVIADNENLKQNSPEKKKSPVNLPPVNKTPRPVKDKQQATTKVVAKIDPQLQKQNRQLQKQLDQIRQIVKANPVGTPAMTYQNEYNFFNPGAIIWFICAAVLLGFLLGMFWSEFHQRRRHGGYKV